jgi:hypothetical protein
MESRSLVGGAAEAMHDRFIAAWAAWPELSLDEGEQGQLHSLNRVLLSHIELRLSGLFDS